MIGQHAPRLEAGRHPQVHYAAWASLVAVLLIIAAAVGVVVGLELWGSTIAVPTGEDLQKTLIELRQSIGGGGFI